MKVKNLIKYIDVTKKIDIVDANTKLILALMAYTWSEIEPFKNYNVITIYPRDRYTLVLEVEKPLKR